MYSYSTVWVAYKSLEDTLSGGDKNIKGCALRCYVFIRAHSYHITPSRGQYFSLFILVTFRDRLVKYASRV